MRALGGLVILSAFAIAAGCASSEGDNSDGDANVQDVTAAPASGTQVDDLAPISPPELRVLKAPLEAVIGPKLESGRRVAVIRSMKLAGKKSRLVVDVDSLVSSVVAEEALEAAAREGEDSDKLDDAPYSKSLAALVASKAALDSVDKDAETGDVAEPFTLTVDMCQSKKAYEKRLFQWAEKLSDQLHKPIPMGIAMTGGWAGAHGSEFDEILGFEKRGKIAITWINHSATHPLHCLNTSCSKADFLTSKEVNFEEEVLGLERVLLGRGLAPSTIFRFPGLVHDEARMKQLAKFSLMPIDADAWIAKGQPIKSHAVVLVHGNGNEADGITGFLKQVEAPTRAAALLSGKSALVSPLLIAPTPPAK